MASTPGFEPGEKVHVKEWTETNLKVFGLEWK